MSRDPELHKNIYSVSVNSQWIMFNDLKKMHCPLPAYSYDPVLFQKTH